jgi:uncharacterized protein
MGTDVIFGATGYVGGRIVNELRSRGGHDIVAVARNVQQLDGVTVRQGSIFDAAFVADVTAGADTIVVSLPPLSDDGPPLADAFPSLVKAASDSGARLGVVGGAGSLLVAPGGPKVFDAPDFPPQYLVASRAHDGILQWLRHDAGQIDWFFVSPAAEFGSANPGERTGSYRTGDDVLLVGADGRSFISGDDFAIAFVDEIERPAHHRARFTVGY